MEKFKLNKFHRPYWVQLKPETGWWVVGEKREFKCHQPHIVSTTKSTCFIMSATVFCVGSLNLWKWKCGRVCRKSDNNAIWVILTLNLIILK